MRGLRPLKKYQTGEELEAVGAVDACGDVWVGGFGYFDNFGVVFGDAAILTPLWFWYNFDKSFGKMFPVLQSVVLRKICRDTLIIIKWQNGHIIYVFITTIFADVEVNIQE